MFMWPAVIGAASGLFLANAKPRSVVQRFSFPTLAPPTLGPAPQKCPCCGSREFKVYGSAMICTYCRTGV